MAQTTLITKAPPNLITLSEIKRWLHWSSTDSSRDEDFQACIEQAQDLVEGLLGISYRANSYLRFNDAWEERVVVNGPLDADSVTVKYYDSDNAEQTLLSSEYVVIPEADTILFNGDQPSLYDRPDAVRIYFSTSATIDDVNGAAQPLQSSRSTAKHYARMIAGELFETPVNDRDDRVRIARRIISPVRRHLI